jgi:eukaryotic-like serine/threonine-protein kinase
VSGILIDRYEILQSFGEPGGFGLTFLAKDRRLPFRKCIIKRFKPARALDSATHEIMRERFEREAAMLERLSSLTTQVPKLYDYFEAAGEFYIVQELIEGKTLAEKVRQEGKLNENPVRVFLTDILPVLVIVHSHAVIHRDIKPTNIIIRDRDDKPVLIDFGTVKEVITTVLDSYGTPLNLSIGVGTGGYTPWEQWSGKPVFASDLYSLGLTAIFLLTGKHPPSITDPATGEFLWRKSTPQLNETFASILDKAIRANYRERYPSAKEMLNALLNDKLASYTDNPGPQDSSPILLTPPQNEIEGSEPTVLALKRFKFEAVISDHTGEMKRYKGRARYFSEELDLDVNLDLVYVPGGTFSIGSPCEEVGRNCYEEPQVEVTLSNFFMSKYQITQSQWRAVAAMSKVRRNLNSDPSFFKGDALPVECVSWKDAVEFCARLNKYTGRLYRLPSEAEWEYACRAGTRTPYAFGPKITKELVNFGRTLSPKSDTQFHNCTVEVGSLGVANKFGLYDMHGNVCEWCLNVWRENYREAPGDTQGWAVVEVGGFRVRRGGSWQSSEYACRSAHRRVARSNLRHSTLGFRVVSDI